MLRFLTRSSRAPSSSAAANALRNAIRTEPNLIVVSSLQSPCAAETLSQLERCFPQATIIGTASGSESSSASTQVTCFAGSLPGASLTPFRIDRPELPDELLADVTLLSSGSQPSTLVFGAPGFGLGATARLLDAAFPEGLHCGGTARGDDVCILSGSGVHSNGAVGVAISGEIRLDALVSHGARPLIALPITKSSGSRIVSFGGASAVDVYRSIEAQTREAFGDDARLQIGLPAHAPSPLAPLTNERLTPAKVRALGPTVLQPVASPAAAGGGDSELDLGADGASSAASLL
jgi:small ligand-binding sensory domain FIST